ncbi:MAG: hypothetical protein KIT10_10550 [Flavobacteriales bacterium]|nr:hypothetical protein [Flavobacteriales bacterium]
MKYTILYLAVALFIGLSMSTNVLAQDVLEAKRLDNPQWHSVVHIKFQAGKMARIQQIWDDMDKINEKAGTPQPVLRLRMSTGEWDVMIVWKMEGGIEDMNWEVRPDNVKGRQAAIAHFGTVEKFKEVRDEYRSYMVASKREIARIR